MAVLHCFGKYPSVKDLLTINFSVGRMPSRHSFRSHVGMGSREQLFVGALAISFLIPESDKDSNLTKVGTSSTISQHDTLFVDKLSPVLSSI